MKKLFKLILMNMGTGFSSAVVLEVIDDQYLNHSWVLVLVILFDLKQAK